jgi:hypothetical protein
MNLDDSITAGKYLISPAVQPLGNGWYASSVSIRSVCGSGKHERVLRMTRLSRSRLAAVRYATAEGLQWIGHSTSDEAVPSARVLTTQKEERCPRKN